MRARLIVVLLVALVGCTAQRADRTIVASSEAPRVDIVIEQPVLRAYVQTLGAWMTPEERARLLTIDYEATARGDAQRLRYLAADHVIRRLLPRALEARGDATLTRYAEQLRRLPPLLDEDTDAVAAPFVRVAMRGLRRSMAGEPVLDPAAAPAQRSDAITESAPLDLESTLGASELVDDMLPPIDPEAEAAVAEALATYAEAYARHHGVSALEADAMAAAASDVVDTGLVHERAIEAWGLPREVVVDEALALASEMAAAARRRERLPRSHRPPTPRQIPPDAPGSPTRP
jgi:hypothetical protein